MTNQLLPLLELGANNKVRGPSLDRNIETKDQGFSRTFHDAEKEITANKADAQAAKDTRSERQESTAKNNRSTENDPVGSSKVVSAEDKNIDSHKEQGPANVANTSESSESSRSANDSENTIGRAASAQASEEANGELTLPINTGEEALLTAAISSELSDIANPDLQLLLDGMVKQLQDVMNSKGLESEIDSEALTQLVDELFVDASQLPISEVVNTISQALSKQPLTVASASQLIGDLRKYGQLSPAIDTTGLKLSAAVTPQATLTPLNSTSITNPSNLLGAGERLETIALQSSTDITSTNIVDKFSVDKLNFAQLLNSTTAGSEASSTKLSPDTSPLQALTNISLPAAVASAKPQLAVALPFQQAQWGQAVAERVMWMSSQGLQEAEIHLNPSELGPMQVKVALVNEQAHVSFVVTNNSVREALDQNAIRLREMFDGEGLNLVDVDVSDHSQQQADSSEDDGHNQHYDSEGSGSDIIQGENQLSINSNGTSLLNLYA